MSSSSASGRKGFWGNLFTSAPQRDRFSLEELQHLHDVLNRNAVVSDSNRELVVESLRSVAELMIWGDQHDPRFFDYFLEHNVISHFSTMLIAKANRRGNVAKQVLQTLSILIQNIRSETALYYMFSNNHINEICTLRFDFEDDEVLGYYINLLKTISLKLTPETVQFFFSDDGEHSSFPLYAEAIKFINHHDGMVRAAVRTLTLSIYCIQDSAVQHFVVSKPASNYFAELAIYLAEQCQALNKLLDTLETGSGGFMVSKVDSSLAEVEDLLSYCNDILCTGTKTLASLLLENLWASFVAPIIFWPLLQPTDANGEELQWRNSSGVASASSRGVGAGVANASSALGAQELPPGRVAKVCALYVLERLLSCVHFTLLVNLLLLALLAGSLDTGRWASSANWSEIGSAEIERLHFGEVKSEEEQAAENARSWHVPPQLPDSYLAALCNDPERFRAAFFSCLLDQDAPTSAAGVRCLIAATQNRSADPEVLDAVGLLPHRRKKNRQLMQELTAPNSPRKAGGPLTASAAVDTSAEANDGEAHAQPASPPADDSRPSSTAAEGGANSEERIASHSSATTSPRSSAAGAVLLSPGRRRARSVAPPPPPRPEQGKYGEGYVVDCLTTLLGQKSVPVASLWAIAWLLLQLLPPVKPGEPCALSVAQSGWLEVAMEGAWAALQEELAGMWADALVVLVCSEWGPARQRLTALRGGSTAAIVQEWMQAAQWRRLASLTGPGRLRPALSADPSLGGTSSQAAHATLSCVQRFVLVYQLRAALRGGLSAIPPSPELPAVTEADFKGAEIREGNEIDLLSRLSCTVAFARGHERQVYFAIKGLPGKVGEELDALEGFSVSTAPPPEAVAGSMPVVVVADPGTRVNSGNALYCGTGLVLSVAPLIGADAYIDAQHGRWLHVHVRPPVRGLLKVVRTSHIGNLHLNVARQLVDGHWVLAFPSPERAWYAKQLIDQHTARLRAFYCDVLSPLYNESEEALVAKDGRVAMPGATARDERAVAA